MERRKDKDKAIILRKRGFSYSQIKKELNINKSTLSGWLAGMPLSQSQMRKLRDFNPIRIEKTRETKRKKKEERLRQVYVRVSADLNKFSKRELFIAGLFLYWAEGTKASPCTLGLSNTDPSMIRFYIKWLEILGVKNNIHIKLHLYSDMNIEKEISYWSKELDLPLKFFRKPYVKKSKFSSLTYRSFGHGTCNVILYSRDWNEYVIQGLKRIAYTFK